MDEKRSLGIEGIDAEDWETTPASVRNLVARLIERIEQLELHLKELQVDNEQINEKVNQNSQNSNSSSANDPLDVKIPSEEGSVFIARMLTVVISLRSQNRNVLEFLTDSIRANRQGTSLLLCCLNLVLS